MMPAPQSAEESPKMNSAGTREELEDEFVGLELLFSWRIRTDRTLLERSWSLWSVRRAPNGRRMEKRRRGRNGDLRAIERRELCFCLKWKKVLSLAPYIIIGL